MIDLIQATHDVLSRANYSVNRFICGNSPALRFESNVVLGFVFAYERPAELVATWKESSTRAIRDNQFALRRAGQKAWNTYLVLLCEGVGAAEDVARLCSIEEDLSGTRKIARMGIAGSSELAKALLPLLPLQSAPQLEAVDSRAEIRQRTTALPSRAVEAFLSDAEPSTVLQAIEASP